MADRLSGKVAVITGATSGIGMETARLFAREGARVAVAGRSADKGEALAAELGDVAFFQQTDVTSEADIAALIDATMERFGQVDCLFSNAGGPTPGGFETITPDQLDYGMRLLLGSVMFGIKHATRVMKPASGGSVINNSSIAAHRAGQGGIVYAAAKAAVSHITRLAGAELGPAGIRVNAISPGAIATPIFWGGSAVARELDDAANARKLEKLERNLARATPTPRTGLSADIAAAALFLASDEGSFINAHDLVVDGGRIAMFHEAPREAAGTQRRLTRGPGHSGSPPPARGSDMNVPPQLQEPQQPHDHAAIRAGPGLARRGSRRRVQQPGQQPVQLALPPRTRAGRARRPRPGAAPPAWPGCAAWPASVSSRAYRRRSRGSWPRVTRPPSTSSSTSCAVLASVNPSSRASCCCGHGPSRSSAGSTPKCRVRRPVPARPWSASAWSPSRRNR